MLLIFTGNGKGKTTAALGQCMRVVGDGGNALVIQFIKSPKWKSGEDYFLEKFKIPDNSFQILKKGLGFVGILGDTLPLEDHKKAASEAWELAKKEILSGKWSLVVLDEINNALRLNLFSLEEVANFLIEFKRSSLKIDLILTGRDAHASLVELADLATEMKEIKHPYQKGEEAKKGIEF